jgi:hypothetical protein
MNAFTKVTSIVLSFPMLAIAQAASDIKPATVFGVTDVASSAPAPPVVTTPHPVTFGVFVESADNLAARKPDRDPSLQTAKNSDAGCPEMGVCAQNAAVLRDLSRIGALTIGEQARVDKAGDDIRHLQQVLLDIDRERIDYWQAKLSTDSDKMSEWERVKNASGYAIYKEGDLPPQYGEPGLKLLQRVNSDKDELSNFLAARTALQLWKPMSFEAYKAGQSGTQGIVSKSAVEQDTVGCNSCWP